MDQTTIARHGEALFAAWRERYVLPALREVEPSMSIADAYAMQQRFVGLRLQAGETIIGKKIGAVSKPIQDFLGVFEPDFGQLTSGMVCSQSAGVNLDELIQPMAEAELAFVLKDDLMGPGIINSDVIRATAYVVPCFEIVDSRIRAWNIKIQDTVADNASGGVFVLSDDKADPRKVDLALAGMVLYKNGELHCTSVGASVQGGSPVNAVTWLANTLGRLGLPLKAGEVILSGAQSHLVEIADGDELSCIMGGMGSCRVRFHGRSAV